MREGGEGTYVNVPDATVDVVRSWPGACLSGITSGQVVPVLCLKVPNGAGEESSGDQVEKAGGDNQEELEFG